VRLAFLILTAGLIALAHADDRIARHYRIGKVAIPPEIDPQIGALAPTSDAKVAACFHHGEVAIYDPQKQTWQKFAEGLHEPLGLLAEKDGSILVMQRPELTRLRDKDGDGVAESYETVWDGFGITGNYHEYAFGPVLAPNGKLLVALNCASGADTVFREVRGEWLNVGLEREKFYGDWKKVSAQVGRMYSRVPWRGWVMEFDPVTREATPFASGFRSPDGIGFDADGRLLVTDNQGDWRGTNELHVVERGGFYGHPASLPWRKDWTEGDPEKVPVERLEALRTRPAIQFPYGRYANSPTQPVVIPRSAAWGPFGGQVIVGEMNSPRLLRTWIERVDGAWQGGCVALLDTPPVKRGINRLLFVGDTLYVGRIHLAWAGDEGLGTVEPTGAFPFDAVDMKITQNGFRFSFTEPLARTASDLSRWKGERYNYAYHPTYGSPELNKSDLAFAKVTLVENDTVANVEVNGFQPGFIYDFDLTMLESAKGETPLNPHIAYTANRLPKP